MSETLKEHALRLVKEIQECPETMGTHCIDVLCDELEPLLRIADITPPRSVDTNPTPQLTEADVREIEARTNAATKGDWTIRGGHWIDGGVKLAGYGIRFSDSPFEERYGGWDARTNYPPETPEGTQASADRSFLAHARVDIDALIRDWRALQRWKAEALPLLTRYDNLAETFGGKLGSSKVTNLEVGVAALREQLNTAADLEMLARDEISGLREQLAEAEKQREWFRRCLAC